MKINLEHLYHGAALTQIAEHPQFTAINVHKTSSGISRSAFRINDDMGVYLKYATKPHTSLREYQFTFTTEHLAELKQLATKTDRVVVALVCVKASHICRLHLSDLRELIERRRKAKKADEPAYTILVTVPKGKSFRVYVNAPGRKKTLLKDELIIPRNAFPDDLFLPQNASAATA